MDATALYTTRSKSYESARPGYPEALIRYLYDDLRLSEAKLIADIGSGTGKFTRLLLERGSKVLAVEPNEEMRQIAERKLAGYEGFLSVDGTASDTRIEEKVDAITAAQAFHWFDQEAFSRECRRILTPGGRVCLTWNLRVPDSEITCACRETFHRYCPRFVDFNIGMKEDDPKIYAFFEGSYGQCEKAVFDNSLRYGEEQFIQRYLSSSYSLREGEEGYEDCIRSVRKIFHAFCQDGEVVVPNQAICYSAEEK